MFSKIPKIGALFLIILSVINSGWTFDFEISMSTAVMFEGIRLDLSYEYMEIGRSSEGFLGVEMTNESSKVVKLLSIKPRIFFTVPGSLLELPMKIPPAGVVSISAFIDPTDTVLEFSFDVGKMRIPLEISRQYEREREEFIKKQLKMIFTFFVAVLMVFLIRGSLEK